MCILQTAQQNANSLKIDMMMSERVGVTATLQTSFRVVVISNVDWDTS